MSPQQQEELWYSFNRFQRTRERIYTPMLNQALKKQINSFIEAYRSNAAMPESAVTLVPIVEVLKPLYLQSAVIYGAKHLAYLPKKKARMPIGYSEQMQALVEQYFSMDFLNDAAGITETTKKQVHDILVKGYSEGLGFDDIVKLLQSPELTAVRARLIARTETVSAANFGAINAAKSSNLKLNKVWIAARDNRTRRDHATVNGNIVPFEDAFNVGGYAMQQPGDKGKGLIKVPAKEICNCRCTVGFIPVR